MNLYLASIPEVIEFCCGSSGMGIGSEVGVAGTFRDEIWGNDPKSPIPELAALLFGKVSCFMSEVLHK